MEAQEEDTVIKERGVKARDVRGSIITGDGNKFYYGEEHKVNWEEVDLTPAYESAKRLFLSYLRRYAGANGNEIEVEKRYVPLQLQATTYKNTQQSMDSKDEGVRTIGYWEKLIEFPSNILLIGDAGVGKTTQMLFGARLLEFEKNRETEFAQKVPVPLILLLRSYSGDSPTQLIEALASSSGLDIPVVDGLMREHRYPVCIFLDGADEISADGVRLLLSHLERWIGINDEARKHSLIISSRPMASVNAINDSNIPFDSYELLPMDPEHTLKMLKQYDLAQLENLISSDINLVSVFQKPDLISALSQSSRNNVVTKLPENMGQIYQLYIKSLAKNIHSNYDFLHVLQPVLSFIAITMLEQQSNRLRIDAQFSAKLIDFVTKQITQNRRKRQIAPPDWNLMSLLQDLGESLFIEVRLDKTALEIIEFARQGYRDYFAAIYMCSDEKNNHIRIEKALQKDRNRWVQAIFMMAGMSTKSDYLLSAFYDQSIDDAIDAWMLNNPRGFKSPKIVFDRCQDEMDRLSTSQLYSFSEPYSRNLIVKLLSDEDPRVRFEATRAATQWGLNGVEPLLDAFQDKNDLVKAVAAYAITHLGETLIDEKGEENPLPPLMNISNSSFHISSFGGGGVTGDIGPILFAPTQQELRLQQFEIDLSIMKIDFDPFEESCSFNISLINPAWYSINHLFSDKKNNDTNINWIRLLAQLNWIIELSKYSK